MLALLLAAVACDAPPVFQPSPDEGSDASFNHTAHTEEASVHADAAKDDLLRAVRRETARYNSTVQGLKGGYAPDEHCVEEAPGGMGFHWVNEDLVDPEFDPLRPEALVYAPGPEGRLQLAALEYIVIDVGQDAPEFGSQAFDEGGTPLPVDHWSLHVWLYVDNPAGLFEPFNPTISCP